MNHSLLMEAGVKLLVDSGVLAPFYGTDLGHTAGVDGTYPWVFQDVRGDAAPFRDPKGTSMSAVVLSSRDDWGTNDHNSMGLPILRLFIYSDPTRDAEGQPVGALDAIRRAERIFAAIDAVFHDLDNSLSGLKIVLGDGPVTIVRSRRRDGFDIQPVPNGDGMERLSAQYEVSTT